MVTTWTFVQSGLGALFFLLMPNLFYFAMAKALENEKGVISPEDQVPDFFWKATIILTLLMIFACFTWINSMLDTYHGGFANI